LLSRSPGDSLPVSPAGNTFEFRISGFDFTVYDDPMSGLLEARGPTVELPTAAGWVRPVNEVSLRIGAGKSLGLPPA
jgi:hypothetical protein